MERLKIFLVEDEIVIRSGIKNGIEWEREGYAFVGEASDGELAYPLILREKPDILITDIRMPFMDGLELIELVKAELPDMKVLILSGYDEFEYAKEGIRLGVTEYMLKPVSAQKLLDSLGEVAKLIRQEKEEKDLLKRYQEDMRENTEHEKLIFLSQLICGKLSMAEAVAQARNCGINLSASLYEIVLFKIFETKQNAQSSHGLGRACEELDRVSENLPGIYSFQRGIDGWTFLLTAENEEEMGELTGELTRRLKSLMEAYRDLEFFGGIGVPVTRLRELPKSFADADYAISGRFVKHTNQIVETGQEEGLEDLGVRGFGEFEKIRESVGKFLNNGTREEIDSFVRIYMEAISEEMLRSTLMRQYIIMDIYVSIMTFCEKLDVTDDSFRLEADGLKNTMQISKKGQAREELRNYMKTLLERGVELRDMVSQRKYADIIQLAKEQIEKTYMSEEISLNSIAARVGMSACYFSSVFGREMGVTFVEYLTAIRMEKARELLMCSSMKTSEIGYEVGYKDSHYFSYLFKKTQGCSPKEYRARRKEGPVTEETGGGERRRL